MGGANCRTCLQWLNQSIHSDYSLKERETGNHREIDAVLLVIRRPNTITGELYKEKLGCL